jgi:hypothetical protein
LNNSASSSPDGGAGSLEGMIADETYGRLTSGQSPETCRIVQLRIEGNTEEEVADAIGKSRGTVSRILKELRRLLD